GALLGAELQAIASAWVVIQHYRQRLADREQHWLAVISACQHHICVAPTLAALASTVTWTVNVCAGAPSGSNERLYTSISVVAPPAAALKTKTCAPPAPGGASAGRMN